MAAFVPLSTFRELALSVDSVDVAARFEIWQVDQGYQFALDRGDGWYVLGTVRDASRGRQFRSVDAVVALMAAEGFAGLLPISLVLSRSAAA